MNVWTLLDTTYFYAGLWAVRAVQTNSRAVVALAQLCVIRHARAWVQTENGVKRCRTKAGHAAQQCARFHP